MHKWFFIDQTLLQLFDYYQFRSIIGRRIARQALHREKLGYEKADGIIVHSHWAAQSVVEDYSIDPQKVHVVLPGANLDPIIYENWEHRHRPASACKGDLRLVFVGKHPLRKGLDRLLRAFRLARVAGATCTLKVIGCTSTDLPKDLQDVSGVEWIGFIDKRQNADRYLDEVAACDIGCLLSRAEAGGIGLREYHALGLAVLGPDTGGSPDHVLPEAAILVSPDANDQAIAEHLIALSQNRDRVEVMKAVSWQRRHEMLWSTTVAKIQNILTQTASIRTSK